MAFQIYFFLSEMPGDTEGFYFLRFIFKIMESRGLQCHVFSFTKILIQPLSFYDAILWLEVIA